MVRVQFLMTFPNILPIAVQNGNYNDTYTFFNSETDGILCMQYIKLIYDLRDYIPGFTKAKVVLSTVRYIISLTSDSKNECFCFFIVVSICIWLLKK